MTDIIELSDKMFFLWDKKVREAINAWLIMSFNKIDDMNVPKEIK